MRFRGLTGLALAVGVMLFSACAAVPPASDPEAVAEFNERNDPLEPMNRKFFAVNETLDHDFVRPVAVGYRDAVPAVIRTHLHSVLSNLSNPAQLANDMLQGKPRKAGNTLMRLLINTTIGVAGVFDVATGWGYPDHDTDFGLTLGLWGVPGGPFLFLPVLGPSNPRDGVGYGANTVLDPLTWVSFAGSATLGWTRFGVSAVDGRSRVLDATDAIDKTALDPYASYRSLSQQKRAGDLANAREDLPPTQAGWYGVAPAP